MSLYHPAVYGALYAELAKQQHNRDLADRVGDMYDTTKQVAYLDDLISSLRDLISVLEAGEADAAEDQRIMAMAEPSTRAAGELKDEHIALADDIASGLRAMADLIQRNPHLANMCQYAFEHLTAPINATFDIRAGIAAYVRAANGRYGMNVKDDTSSAGVKIWFSDRVRLFVYNKRELVLERHVDGVRTDDDSVTGDEQWLMPDFGIQAPRDAAPVQDEDQSTSRPATPARGHVHGLAAHAADEDDDRTTYSAEQLDGTACIVCGTEFTVAVGEGSEVVGMHDGGQLFAHTSCMAPVEIPDLTVASNRTAVRETHIPVKRRDGEQLCRKCLGLWPCLALRAVEVAEDFSTTQPAPPTGEPS